MDGEILIAIIAALAALPFRETRRGGVASCELDDAGVGQLNAHRLQRHQMRQQLHDSVWTSCESIQCLLFSQYFGAPRARPRFCCKSPCRWRDPPTRWSGLL